MVSMDSIGDCYHNAYKYPRWIRFVENLPRTATGKLQRFRLRELAGELARTLATR